MGRAPCCDKANVKKGPWSPEEDAKLKAYIEQHGTGGNWIALPQKAGLKRCGKSCRLRWLNYLRPDIRHGGFTEEEDAIICSLYATIGSRWSIIAAQLPGRTDNDIKNYWNTRLKKKLMGKRKDQQSRRIKAEEAVNSNTTPGYYPSEAMSASSMNAIRFMLLSKRNSEIPYLNGNGFSETLQAMSMDPSMYGHSLAQNGGHANFGMAQNSSIMSGSELAVLGFTNTAATHAHEVDEMAHIDNGGSGLRKLLLWPEMESNISMSQIPNVTSDSQMMCSPFVQQMINAHESGMNINVKTEGTYGNNNVGVQLEYPPPLRDNCSSSSEENYTTSSWIQDNGMNNGSEEQSGLSYESLYWNTTTATPATSGSLVEHKPQHADLSASTSASLCDYSSSQPECLDYGFMATPPMSDNSHFQGLLPNSGLLY